MVRSAERALEILEISGANKKGLKHGEIAQALNIPKSSLSKLLGSLVAKGYLTLDTASRSYAIGPQVLVLASSYLASLDVVQISQPIVHEVMLKTGESASLMIKKGNEALIVYKEISNQPMIIATLNIGDLVPLYASACGKAMLAFLPGEELDRYFSSAELTPFTRKTITDAVMLKQELDAIRASGVAYSDEELYEDLFGMATPVFDWDHRVVASLTVSFPRMRLTPEKQEIIANVLRDSSAEISGKLGLSRNPVSFHGKE